MRANTSLSAPGQFYIHNIGLDRVRIAFRRQAHCLWLDSEDHLGAVRHDAFHLISRQFDRLPALR